MKYIIKIPEQLLPLTVHNKQIYTYMKLKHSCQDISIFNSSQHKNNTNKQAYGTFTLLKQVFSHLNEHRAIT